VWGAPERNYRRYYAEAERDAIRKGLDDYVKGRYRAKKLEKYEATDASNIAIPFRLTLEATGAARGTTSGGEAAVAIEPGPITAELPEEIVEATDTEEPRKNDLYLPKAFRTEWRYRIVPPPGFAARMGTVLNALGNGLAMEKLTDPDAVPDELLGDTISMIFNALVIAARSEEGMSP